MNTIENDKKKIKQLKGLVPVSRLILQALMEQSYGETYSEEAIAFLSEAQDVWKNKHSEKAYHHPGAYYLGRTYQELEKAEIISPDGKVWNSNAMLVPGRINGRLCRPREFAPICYEETAAFKKLAFSVDRGNTGASR